MKMLRDLIGKNIRVYLNSFLSIHLSIIILSFIIYCAGIKLNILNLTSEDFLNILNGMGVLTAFIILALDKINLPSLKELFNGLTKNYKGEDIVAGVKLANTVFSIVFSVFLLLGVQYILLIFKLNSIFLLISLIVTLFSGFLLVLSIWHANDI